MFNLAALTLSGVAGEQDDDSVEIRAGEAAHPTFRVIYAGVAEHFRAGDHSLPELFRERGQRSLVDTQCAQAVPGEGDRHPTFVLVHRSLHRHSRLHLVCNHR